MLRVVFFGSSDYAIPSLRALVAAGEPPILVVTHPERSRRRGRGPAPGVLRQTAEELGLPVVMEPDVNQAGFRERLASLEADLALVISFGQIFRAPLLETPRLGCFNAHGSLLPRHRGAAPIQWALLEGDARTGVTIIRMTPGMDRGPMLLQKSTPIAGREDGIALRARLAELSASAFLAATGRLARGPVELEPQDEAQATYARKLLHEDGLLDWAGSAEAVDRKVRALLHAPGAFTRWRERLLHVREGRPEPAGVARAPGTILSAGEEGILVAAGDGAYRIELLKPEGSRQMRAADFLRGARLRVGELFS